MATSTRYDSQLCRRMTSLLALSTSIHKYGCIRAPLCPKSLRLSWTPLLLVHPMALHFFSEPLPAYTQETGRLRFISTRFRQHPFDKALL
jgi:hypothetical protein